MNRRRFLQGVAGVGAALVLPSLEKKEPITDVYGNPVVSPEESRLQTQSHWTKATVNGQAIYIPVWTT